MIYLIASIILTSYLTLSFKAVGLLKIPVFQAIVFNYITCVITGSIVNGSFPKSSASANEPWFTWAGIMGTMFIVLFNLIGITTQKLGVAVASVANKLSLVIPFVFSLYLYNESSTILKIIGIIMALVAVVFTCLPAKKHENASHKNLSKALTILLPAILFLGSGLLDTLVKYVEQTYLNETNSNAYLITSFGTAATIGSILLIIMIILKKQTFDPRSMLAGIAIGIPNYFSILTLVHVLKQSPGESSTIIPVVNMGIVLFSSVMAWIIFKERLSVINWLGIILSIAAISLIAFG